MLLSIDSKLFGILCLIVLISVKCASLKCPSGWYYDKGLDNCARCRGTNNCPIDQGSGYKQTKGFPKGSTRQPSTTDKYGCSQGQGYAFYDEGLDNCNQCSTICNSIQFQQNYGIVRCKKKCPRYYKDTFETKSKALTTKSTEKTSESKPKASNTTESGTTMHATPLQQTPKEIDTKFVTFGTIVGIIVVLVVGMTALCNKKKICDTISKYLTPANNFVKTEQPTDCGPCTSNNSSLSGSRESMLGIHNTESKEYDV